MNSRPSWRVLRLLVLALALVVGGCRDAVPSVPGTPPSADFILAAGDSSFWVTSARGSITVRSAPLTLARLTGRFYELYVADDDRSFEDALLIGQRVYRRDLVTGDSLLVYEDTIVPRLARIYARLHPADMPLGPNDEASDDPRWRVSSTLEFADLHGPFLSFTLHADIERDDRPAWHTSRRGVIDLLSGREATLAQIVGADEPSIVRRRTLAVAATLDSVRAGGARIDRERTAELLHSYRLDPSGFVLTTLNGQPAVAYALSGTGSGEEGHLLELPPISIGEPVWWRDVAASTPISSTDGARDVWRHGASEVVVRYDTSASAARLVLRDSNSREWPVARVPASGHRIFWLEHPTVDSTSRYALTRAFEESALYDESVRTAVFRSRSSRVVPRLARARRGPAASARSVSLRTRA